MNLLQICIGQAGNQIGDDLFSSINNNYTDNYISHNFNKNRFSIDSETKVIKKKEDQSNYITNNNGRGNNWAFGYSIDYKENKNNKNLVNESYEKLYSYMEKLDFVNGFSIFHSILGGTGSGVSSRIIEMIRNDFPKGLIIDIPVYGFKNESSIIYKYNKLLSLSSTYSEADVILPFDNEKIYNFLVSNEKKDGNNINTNRSVSFQEINSFYISSYINTILNPYQQRQTLVNSSIFSNKKFLVMSTEVSNPEKIRRNINFFSEKTFISNGTIVCFDEDEVFHCKSGFLPSNMKINRIPKIGKNKKEVGIVIDCHVWRKELFELIENVEKSLRLR